MNAQDVILPSAIGLFVIRFLYDMSVKVCLYILTRRTWTGGLSQWYADMENKIRAPPVKDVISNLENINSSNYGVNCSGNW